VLDLVTTIIVHFYIDFTSRLLKQICLFPYPHGFCNPVRIHRMKINELYDIYLHSVSLAEVFLDKLELSDKQIRLRGYKQT